MLESDHTRQRIRLDRLGDYPIRPYFFLSYQDQSYFFFHPHPLFLLTICLLLFLSFFNFSLLKAAIPLLAIYLYQRKKMKRFQNGFRFKRSFEDKGTEEEDFKFSYEIENASPYALRRGYLVDQFSGSKCDKRGNLQFARFEELSAHKKKTFNFDVNLNEGMGEKEFGPMGLVLTDPLGISRLYLEDEKIDMMTVYPKVYPSRNLPVFASKTSSQFGLFDTEVKGDNVNFFGTRDYRPGDNVKHINWKLSLKGNDLIINEFEKNVNADIHLVFIDDQRLHSGMGADSSFEYCKDLLLSLCYHHVKSNNQLSLTTLQKRLSARSGLGGVHAIEMAMTKLDPKKSSYYQIYESRKSGKREIQEFGKKVISQLSHETNLYIFTGVMPGKFWQQYLSEIKMWSRTAKCTRLIMCNALHQIANTLESSEGSAYRIMAGQLNDTREKTFQYLKNTSIEASWIDVTDKNLYPEIFKNALLAKKRKPHADVP